MRRQRFTASVVESTKSQTLIRPSKHAHRLRGFAWVAVHLWTILFGAFCEYHPQGSQRREVANIWLGIVYHPQNVQLKVSSKMLQIYYWDLNYQHLIILALITSLSFVIRNWHHLLIREAADKLKRYNFYKVKLVGWVLCSVSDNLY